MTPTTPDCHDSQEAHSLITVTAKSGKGTARQTIRVEPELWDEFGAAAEQVDTDRSALVRDFIAWFLRKPGAKQPPRIPPAGK
jgi:hypothetical protein